MRVSRAAGWMLLGLFVLALILIPFVLGEERLTELSRAFLSAPVHRAALAGIVVLLLASDLFLPVPSSLVSAGAVAALGPALGAAAVWLGMSLGALLGYSVGKSGGRALALRVVGQEELERAGALHERFGAAVLVVCRGVPVLAEASSLFAGLVRMPVAKFAFVAGTANAGLALTYALFGDLASGALSLIAPFALGILVPALAIAVVTRLEAKRNAR